MTGESPSKPTVGTLIDLAVQVDRDEAEQDAALRRRDRAIGQELGAAAEPTAAQVPGLITGWLAALREAPRRGGDALTLLTVAAAAIGLLLGYSSAMGLFYYDGSSPVNVVPIVAVYVGLQAVTLLIFGLATLPQGVPGAEGLRSLSPGRLVGLIARWLPGKQRDAWARIVGKAGRHQLVYGRVQKWQVLTWSQTIALAFNLAAVAGALQLIVFSDLAFGWSTTLDPDPGTVHRIAEALGSPWRWTGLDAAVSLEVVHATQTYRAEWADRQLAPELATKWWPWLVTTMAVYGVLPRLATVFWTRRRLSAAVRDALVATPGVDRLVGRLSSAIVQTQAVEVEAAGRPSDKALPAATVTAGSVCVIRWASAPFDGEAMDAGGAELADDQRTIEAAVAASGDGKAGPVRVVVRAWEPPMLEFMDFLGDLRAGLGRGRTIEVQPVGEGDRGVWRRKLGQSNDPWLRLVGEEADLAASPAATEGSGS